MIKLEIITEKEIIDVTQLVETVTWSGDYTQAARQLEFSTVSLPYDKNIPKVDIALGSMVKFYENNKEIFRGYVFSREKKYNSTTISYTAFDVCIYLLKNEGVYNFKGKKPEEITNKIFNDFKIPKGNIVSTGYKINRKFFGVTLYDIIMTSYTLASIQNKKKYMITSNKGKVSVEEKGKITLDIRFDNGGNIIDSNYSEDINDMVNRVLVVDDNGKTVAEGKKANWIKSYGQFQKILKQEEGKNSKDQANSELKGINRKASISGFGDTSCITGCGVTVKDSYTGLIGLFYIDSDTHTWTNGLYTIDLTLNFVNIMNVIEAGEDEDENDKKNTSNNNSNNSSSNNKGLKVIEIAERYLGTPYVWGGSSPSGFDCSGLCVYVFKQVGVTLSRTTYSQIQGGKAVDKKDLRAGDLVFFNIYGSGASHVGIYAKNGKFIHATQPGDVVKYSDINSSYYFSKYYGARRYL